VLTLLSPGLGGGFNGTFKEFALFGLLGGIKKAGLWFTGLFEGGPGGNNEVRRVC